MNGYINVSLGGKKRGVKFGNRALLDVMSKHQVSQGIKFSFDLIADLVFFGMVNNCMITKQNVDFTPEEVAEWVDDMPMEELLEIFNVFQKSYAGENTKDATVKNIASAKTPRAAKSNAVKKN